MANIKISELPQVTSLSNTDVFPSVAGVTTSKITLKNLADSLPIVSSSISASSAFAANSAVNLIGYNSLFGTPSSAIINFTVTVLTKTSNHRYFGIGSALGYLINGIESPFLTLLPGKTYRFLQDNASNSTHQLLFYYDAAKTTQYVTNVITNGTAGSAGSYTEIVVTDTTPIVLHYQCINHAYMGNAAQFNSNVIDTPYKIIARSGTDVSGSAKITGSLTITGSIIVDTGGISANYVYPVNYGYDWSDPAIQVDKKPGFAHFYPSFTNSGVGNNNGTNYYLADVNFGQRMQSSKAGVLKFSRDFAAVPNTRIYTLVSDGLSTSDSNTNVFGYNLLNAQYHVLTVTGSFRSVDNTSLGSTTANKHYITGSVLASGSFTQNGFVILPQVLTSLDFANDTAAAAGGVPLGGLYRNGNVIAIRIS